MRFNLDKIKRAGDTVAKGNQNDIVILVMGPTGSGKSTFLKHVLESIPSYQGPKPAVSDGFDSCTRELGCYTIPPGLVKDGSKQLVLVDTPGFDDTNVSDSEILRRISVWLASSYDAKMKVGGILYMFPIYPNRITRNDKANLKVFQELCGNNSLKKVRMVTTKWAICPKPAIGEDREKQLLSTYWVDFVNAGSKLARLDNDANSATALFHEVLKVSQQFQELNEMALALQQEIVSQAKSVPRTEAGRELKRKLEQLLKEHKQASGDYETRMQKLQNIASQLKDLKIPFGERLKMFFGLA